MTELLGTLNVLAETSGVIQFRSTFLGMGFKIIFPTAPGERDTGDEEFSTFQ